ncbi:hypothetical protein GF339_20945, partial [candidate division KSB3 bacterium]|nr:hypothetical protein [candidate division KSB3 bacterium]MBD3327067.1 hypothetical protein [candidate division KSB3 bacterium]
MNTKFRTMQWIALVLVLLMGMAGCSFFDQHDSSSPTAPVGSATQLANFWVGRGQDKYEVNVGDDELHVGVPAGAYLLTYTTENGTFYIVFEAEESVMLVIGIPGDDEVLEAYIQAGTIDLEGLGEEIEPIEGDRYIVYALPDETLDLPDWFEVFEEGENFLIIELIVDGEIVLEEDEGEDGEGEEGEENGLKHEVTISVDGSGGTVKPSGTKLVPDGASISIKIQPDSGNFADIANVTINGEPFMDYVQELGNGDGHLVIHGVDQDLD